MADFAAGATLTPLNVGIQLDKTGAVTSAGISYNVILPSKQVVLRYHQLPLTGPQTATLSAMLTAYCAAQAAAEGLTLTP